MLYGINKVQKYHPPAYSVPFSPQNKNPSEGDGERRQCAEIDFLERSEPRKNMLTRGFGSIPDLVYPDGSPCGEVKSISLIENKKIRFGQDEEFAKSLKLAAMKKFRWDEAISDEELLKRTSSLGVKRLTDMLGEKKWNDKQDEFFYGFFKKARCAFLVTEHLWMPVGYKTRESGMIRVTGISSGNEIEVRIDKDLYRQFHDTKGCRRAGTS